MKKNLLGVGKLLVSAALLSYLLTLIDLETLLSRFTSIKWGFLALAVVMLLSQISLSSLKWQLILKSDAVEFSYFFLLRTYLIGNFFSLFLPSSFGGDIYRVITIKNRSASLIKSTSSVLFDRLTGLLALISIAAFSYLALPKSSHKILVLVCYIASLSCFALAASETFYKKLDLARSRFLSKAAHMLRSFGTYGRDKKLILMALSISFVFQFSVVVIIKLYCMALDIDMLFSYLLVIVPLILLTEMLPISINGIGVRDSAFVFFFVWLGYSSEEGFAVALLLLVTRYSFGLIGGSVLLSSVLKQEIKGRSRC